MRTGTLTVDLYLEKPRREDDWDRCRREHDVMNEIQRVRCTTRCNFTDIQSDGARRVQIRRADQEEPPLSAQ